MTESKFQPYWALRTLGRRITCSDCGIYSEQRVTRCAVFLSPGIDSAFSPTDAFLEHSLTTNMRCELGSSRTFHWIQSVGIGIRI